MTYDPPMAKESTLNIRIDASDRELLEAAAKADDRPVSSLARRILAAWVNGTPPPDRSAVEIALANRKP